MSTLAESTIRRARLSDHDGVCRLLDTLDELHRRRLPRIFAVPDAQHRSEPFFAELLKRDDSAVFVADAGHLVGVAVGLMRAAPDLPMYIQQRWGMLDAVVVDPASQRRGIGKRLAQSVEAWAIGLGAPWVEVNVYDINAEARRFYDALGYVPLSAKLCKPRPDGA